MTLLLSGQEALGLAYFVVEALPNGRKRSEPEVPWRQVTRTRTQWPKGCFRETLIIATMIKTKNKEPERENLQENKMEYAARKIFNQWNENLEF